MTAEQDDNNEPEISEESLASVKRGIEQSAKGETQDLGSFSQYSEE